MNDTPIIEGTANDFTTRMSIKRINFDRELAVLKGQIDLLETTEYITPEIKKLLISQLDSIVNWNIRMESDYYDMRNKLEEWENKK